MLRKIDYEEIAYIYENWLIKHFPQNEVKPLINIKNMYEIGGYEAYAWYEGENLRGYAYMCKNPAEKYVLLDYLAILDDYRGMGYGSKILKELKNVISETEAIIIETEDLDKAASKQEKEERVRRDSFYTGNGIIKSGLTATVYEADYRVWYMPFGKILTDAEIADAYDKIYRFMLSEKGYANCFKMFAN